MKVEPLSTVYAVRVSQGEIDLLVKVISTALGRDTGNAALTAAERNTLEALVRDFYFAPDAGE